MAKALVNFLNKISQNQIRTQNAFEMVVTSGYNDVDKVLEDITMYGQGFTIPGRTQNFTDVSFKGYAVPIPTNMQMENEHTVTINADFQGELRRAFLAWQAKVQDPAISDGSVFSGDRRVNNKSIIRIHLLDDQFTDVAEVYKMIGVKIMTVGPLTVSNTDANVATFDVTFKSLYWEIEESAAGAFVGQK